MPFLYANDPFLLIQHLLAVSWLDAPMAALSIASEGWALALLSLVLFWEAKQDFRRGASEAAPILLALLLAGVAAQALKYAFTMPRPLAVLGPARVHVVLEPLYRRAFPSGHAAALAALAACATLLHGGRARWLWALAILGGLSRIYVGAHWATDVVAGWALGAAVGLAVGLLARRGEVGPAQI